ALYALDDLVLELNLEGLGREDLDCLLQELSWIRVDNSNSKPSLYLSVAPSNDEFRMPRNCREVLRADGFLGVESANDFYLTDGSSVFHLRPTRGEGYARLTPSFFAKPRLAQASFWCFGLLKLLRTLGIYCLHAAALLSRDGGGFLLVG